MTLKIINNTSYFCTKNWGNYKIWKYYTNYIHFYFFSKNYWYLLTLKNLLNYKIWEDYINAPFRFTWGDVTINSLGYLLLLLYYYIYNFDAKNNKENTWQVKITKEKLPSQNYKRIQNFQKSRKTKLIN